MKYTTILHNLIIAACVCNCAIILVQLVFLIAVPHTSAEVIVNAARAADDRAFDTIATMLARAERREAVLVIAGNSVAAALSGLAVWKMRHCRTAAAQSQPEVDDVHPQV